MCDCLNGKRVAVMVEDLYANLELWYPVLRLQEAGAKVTIVGPEAGRDYHSKEGNPARSDVAAHAVTAGDFDALVIPGGYAPDRMRMNADLVRLVRETFQQGKVAAAICHGGWMLAEADLLRGRTVTCAKAIKTDMINAGAHYVDQEAVVDGRLITSRRPSDLPAFCREIIKLMSAE